MKNTQADPFLEKYVAKYDRWLSKKKISFSSKVIPVSESIDTRQQVLPTEQVMAILGAARSVAVQNCACREHYRRCDNPLEVCFLLNQTADALVSKGKARHVDQEEARDILKAANKSGLVHLSLYMPDHEIFALCSCCPCCCHDLQIVRKFGRRELMVRSEYVAGTDLDVCVHCGVCVDRCPFDARSFENETMTYHADACLGCGLCITVCPVGATSMTLREPGRNAASETMPHNGKTDRTGQDHHAR